jgi:hypothetical protein
MRVVMPAAIDIAPAIDRATSAIGTTLRSGDLWSVHEDARRPV